MEASHSLNPTQHAVLAYAIENNNGKITWFPDKVNGGARKKVLAGLSNRALITSNGADHLVAAEGYDALGLQRPAFAWPEVTTPADPELETAVATVEAQWAEADIDDNAPVCAESQDGTVPDTENEANVGASLPTCGQDNTGEQDHHDSGVKCAKEVAIIQIALDERIAKVTQRDTRQATIIRMLRRPDGATVEQMCACTGWQAHSVRGTFSAAFKKKLGLTITSRPPRNGKEMRLKFGRNFV